MTTPAKNARCVTPGPPSGHENQEGHNHNNYHRNLGRGVHLYVLEKTAANSMYLEKTKEKHFLRKKTQLIQLF